jgi:hypothetical protein
VEPATATADVLNDTAAAAAEAVVQEEEEEEEKTQDLADTSTDAAEAAKPAAAP